MIAKKYTNISIIFLVASLFLLQSCYKDKFDFSNLNDTITLAPNLGVPVAYGELTMRDLAKPKKDTIQYYTEGNDIDTLIKFIYNIDTIQNYRALEFLKPPKIEPISRTVKLGVLTIDNQNSDTSLTFNKFVSDNFSVADYNYYDGIKGVASDVVSKSGSQDSTYNLNKFSAIAWVYTLTGKVRLTISNTFKVPLKCKVHLQTGLSLYETKDIADFDFTDVAIQPGQSVTKSVDVNGVKISSQISYKFSDVTLEAKNPATINMNDKMYLTLELADLKVSAGKATIPTQSLPKGDTSMYFMIDTYKGKKLTRLDVHSGILNFDVTSKIPGLSLTLTLPDVKKGGKVVKNTFSFTGAGKLSKTWDLSGFSMDLSKNPAQHYNSMLVQLKYEIISNGQQISFNSDNDFSVTISNADSVQFEYVEGNLGHDTIQIGKKEFDYNIDEFMKDYFKGKVTFTDPRLDLNFTNSVGMSASTNLSLTGKTKEGKELSLFAPNTYHEIGAALIPYDTVYPQISVNKDNSSIVNFISSLPHTLVADGQIITNKGVSDAYLTQHPNFITRYSTISAQVHAEIPLKLSMEDVILTQEFDLDAGGEDTYDSFTEGDQVKIVFYTRNQFPLDATINVLLLDTTLSTNKILDTLVVEVVKAAPTDDQGKVSRTTYSHHREEIILTKTANQNNTMSNFFKSNKIKIEAKLNTYNKKAVKIYSYYSLAFQLGMKAQVKYKTSLGINKK